MITLIIDEYLGLKGKTRYWLSKQCGISQNNMAKICAGETNSIRFETLEKICKVLDCTPNDIISSDDPQLNRLLAYYTKFNELTNQTKSGTE